MAEDQAAGMPPSAGNTILALGAGEAGPEPAAAPGTARAPARYAGDLVPQGFGLGKGGFLGKVFGSAASQSRLQEEAATVKQIIGSNMFGEGVVTGRRRFDGTYPVAICLDSGLRGPASNLFHGRPSGPQLRRGGRLWTHKLLDKSTRRCININLLNFEDAPANPLAYHPPTNGCAQSTPAGPVR